MQNYKELYILGYPIETKIGKLHFVKVKEYPILINYMGFINLKKFEIVNYIKKLDRELAEFLNSLAFIEIIKRVPQLGLQNKFEELFLLCFREDVFDKIQTDDELDEYLELIRITNAIPKEEKSPNPEIERWNKMKRQYDAMRGVNISVESIITSVWVSTGENPMENMTLYQLHSLFTRIMQYKNFDATTLYSSVSSEVKVEPWYKHIDINEGKKKQTLEDVNNKFNGIM